MPKYYLDSSENISDRLEDAIEVYEDLASAQAAAIRRAIASAATVFYVREVIQSSKLVYRAEATLTVDSKVVSDDPLAG